MKNYLPRISKDPIIEKIKISSSPDDIYSLFSEERDTSLLNSSLNTDAGRYSFIGINPFLTLKSIGNEIILEIDEHKIPFQKDPFEGLASVFAAYRIKNTTSLPFIGGGIGYLSYDLKNTIEKLPQNTKNDLELPEMYFVLYQAILIFDNKYPDHAHISAIEIDLPDRIKARDLIKQIKQKLKTLPPLDPASGIRHSESNISSNFTKEEYIDAIVKTIEYIKAGDIYQVCLSQRFNAKWTKSAYSLYKKLNSISPAPFSGYLNFKEAKVISSSPELFLRFEDRQIETRPMKGTRPRGKNTEQDTLLKKALRNSIKDASELSMIVDLERNDIGKVSTPGSVRVEEHRRIETYPTVYQTISIVKSELNKDYCLTDLIKAAWPGGSISGCPKIRAMEIIDELEPTARSVYTGSIGYISFHETMSLNIAIRTMILKDTDVFFQAGGGITAESDPETEYEETLHKAKALIEALS